LPALAHTASILQLTQLPQLIYSSFAFLGTVAYSQGFARPRWRLAKLVTISTFLGFGSYTLGFNQKLSAHFKFARSLENPAGFNHALRNINARLGGPEHFPYGVPERRGELMGVVLGPGVAALSGDPNLGESTPETTEPAEGWTVPPSQKQEQSQGKYIYVMVSCVIPAASASTKTTSANQLYLNIDLIPLPPLSAFGLTYYLVAQQTSQPNVQRPPSKWGEIRAANNKAGAPSSWDLIRQNHERNRIASSPQPSPHPGDPNEDRNTGGGTHDPYNSPDTYSTTAIDENEKKWDKRALDETQFEAMLEAEKRRTSQT
jgi:hypothetical protein